MKPPAPGVRFARRHFAFRGFSLPEVIGAFFIVTLVLLPIYDSLNRSVVETERACAEAFAISQAKGVMDILLFQVPLRCLRAGNPCIFSDPGGQYADLLSLTTRKMFREGYQIPGKRGEYQGFGVLREEKRGFNYVVQVKCIDLPDVPLKVDEKQFLPAQLTTADSSGKCVLMKKVIVEVRWSLVKHEDPLMCSNPRKIFLVGIKSDLEG